MFLITKEEFVKNYFGRNPKAGEHGIRYNPHSSQLLIHSFINDYSAIACITTTNNFILNFNNLFEVCNKITKISPIDVQTAQSNMFSHGGALEHCKYFYLLKED